MSAEAAFRKVSEEIGAQSVALAEELTLTTAELSYLQERRQAYENLGDAHRPRGRQIGDDQPHPGRALRHAARPVAARARPGKPRQRMNKAEKKAAALPPEADRADDPVLPAGAVRRHHRSGGHPGHPRDASVNSSPALGGQLCRRSGAGTERPAYSYERAGVPGAAGGPASPVSVDFSFFQLFCWASIDLRYATLAAACSGERSLAAIFSASWKRPDRPTASARFWRTRLSALGSATALREDRLGLLQFAGQHVGHAEIGQHRRLVRRQVERLPVEPRGPRRACRVWSRIAASADSSRQSG